MNLFRSEEHTKAWSLYDPASEEAIMQVEKCANGRSMFKHRLDSDCLSRVREYRGGSGKTGPFFSGER